MAEINESGSRMPKDLFRLVLLGLHAMGVYDPVNNDSVVIRDDSIVYAFTTNDYGPAQLNVRDYGMPGPNVLYMEFYMHAPVELISSIESNAEKVAQAVRELNFRLAGKTRVTRFVETSERALVEEEEEALRLRLVDDELHWGPRACALHPDTSVAHDCGVVVYRLEWIVTDSVEPADFEAMFHFGMSGMSEVLPILTKVATSDAPVDEIIRDFMDGRHESIESIAREIDDLLDDQ